MWNERNGATNPHPKSAHEKPFQSIKVTPPPLNAALTLEDYKAFFESLGKAVISSATNVKGEIIYANDKFVEVSQYSREELLGKNHRILKSGYHPPEFFKNMWKTISSGRVWCGEIKNRAKDGSYYWVDASIAPVLRADGKPVKYVSVRFLITEKKQAEEALRQSIEKLESWKKALDQFAIVAETDATGKITYVNDQFCKIAKYRREELLGKDHRDVVNSKYHPKEFWEGFWSTIQQGRVWRGDIRNRAKDREIYWVDTTVVPFMGANGKPEKYLAIRAVITEQKNLEMSLIIIDNLLDLSRLESGRANIQRKELNLNSLIHEVLQSFQGVEEKFMQNLPEVEADPDMISQVLVNLLSNAVRYAKSKIVVKTARIGGDIQTSVANDGPGIPAEKLGALFEKFAQLDRANHKASYKGTGLGLAISKEIIERHKGKIWAESDGEKGVAFHFTLPIREGGDRK